LPGCGTKSLAGRDNLENCRTGGGAATLQLLNLGAGRIVLPRTGFSVCSTARGVSPRDDTESLCERGSRGDLPSLISLTNSSGAIPISIFSMARVVFDFISYLILSSSFILLKTSLVKMPFVSISFIGK
jgi:hypothetical protein